MTATDSDHGRKTSKTAMYLSALVYPGAGELLQRRWLAAALIIVAFTASSAVFFWRSIRLLMAYYSFALDFLHAEPTPVHIRALAVPFAVSMAVYIVGLVDTAWGGRQAHGS